MKKDIAFNKLEYDKNYKKQHKKHFGVDLNIDEMNELNKLLEENNITKADFLRNAINNFKLSLSIDISKKR